MVTTSASKFVSMAGKAGAKIKGHCGVSRPTCPDNSCCEQGETCCQQQDGSYGCCPFEGGSCCLDRKSCCPEKYTCNLREQGCTLNGTTIGLSKFVKVTQGLCGPGFRSCKDGSCCEKGQSCCQMFDGLQGCAPFPDATCCSDGKHACPDGTTCDTIHGKCVDILTSDAFPISALKYSNVPPGASLVCAADEGTCASGNCCEPDSTCCTDTKGFDNCCPFTDGIC